MAKVNFAEHSPAPTPLRRRSSSTTRCMRRRRSRRPRRCTCGSGCVALVSGTWRGGNVDAREQANVMLAYPIPEAEDLLDNKLKTAQQSLANCEEDMDFLREQITVRIAAPKGGDGDC